MSKDINYRKMKLNRIRKLLNEIRISADTDIEYKYNSCELRETIYRACSNTADMLDRYIRCQSTYKENLPKGAQIFGAAEYIEQMKEEDFSVIYGNIREQVIAFILLFATQLTPLANTPDARHTLGLFKDLENLLTVNSKTKGENNGR